MEDELMAADLLFQELLLSLLMINWHRCPGIFSPSHNMAFTTGISYKSLIWSLHLVSPRHELLLGSRLSSVLSKSGGCFVFHHPAPACKPTQLRRCLAFIVLVQLPLWEQILAQRSNQTLAHFFYWSNPKPAHCLAIVILYHINYTNIVNKSINIKCKYWFPDYDIEVSSE